MTRIPLSIPRTPYPTKYRLRHSRTSRRIKRVRNRARPGRSSCGGSGRRTGNALGTFLVIALPADCWANTLACEVAVAVAADPVDVGIVGG